MKWWSYHKRKIRKNERNRSCFSSTLHVKMREDGPIVRNTQVLWLKESMVASWYPMRKTAPLEWEIQQRIADETLFSKDVKRSLILWEDKRTGHDNFLTGIVVQFDLEFSVKARYEMQRYHFMDFVSSMSLMHRLTQMQLDEIFNKYVTPEMVDQMKELMRQYKENPTTENELKLLYNCPMWVQFTARMTTNYRQLRTIYHQRRDHKLPDRQKFCDRIETLPFHELITNDARPFENPARNGAEFRRTKSEWNSKAL